MQVPEVVNRCQKNETGWHCRIRVSQKARPTTTETPITVHRMAWWTLDIVRRRRANAMDILAMTQVKT